MNTKLARFTIGTPNMKTLPEMAQYLEELVSIPVHSISWTWLDDYRLQQAVVVQPAPRDGQYYFDVVTHRPSVAVLAEFFNRTEEEAMRHYNVELFEV